MSLPSGHPRDLKELQALIRDLPLSPSNKSAFNAFLVGFSSNVLLDGIVPAVLRRKSSVDALKTFVSKASMKSGISLALFCLFYHSLLKKFAKLRLRLIKATPSPDSYDRSMYRSRLKARIVRLLRSASVVPFLSALLATPALLLFPNERLRKSISLYVFTKGFEAVYRELRKTDSRIVRWVPEWMGGGFFYAIGNSQLLYAFLFEPDCFPESYGKLILSQSSTYMPRRPAGLDASITWPKEREILDTIAILSQRTNTSSPYPSFSAPVLSALTPSSRPTTPFDLINPIVDYAPAHPSHSRLLCAILHPTEPSCSKNFFNFFIREFVASAKFMAAISAFSQLFAWKRSLKNPETALLKFTLSVLQGATVISGSIGTAWVMICALQRLLPKTFLPKTRYLLNGFASSIFIFAVPSKRRGVLGSYVARTSLSSTWKTLEKHRKVKTIRNGDMILLAIGMGMLTTLYERNPNPKTNSSLDPSIYRSLRLLLGTSTLPVVT